MVREDFGLKGGGLLLFFILSRGGVGWGGGGGEWVGGGGGGGWGLARHSTIMEMANLIAWTCEHGQRAVCSGDLVVVLKCVVVVCCGVL